MSGITYFFLPLFYLLPLAFPPIIFCTDGGGNVSRVCFHLQEMHEHSNRLTTTLQKKTCSYISDSWRH